MEITINKSLILLKSIKERISDLKQLRTEVATTKRTYYDGNKEEKIPMYDVKYLDKNILSLQKIVFNIESRIKESNNVNFIKISDNIEDTIFSSII